MSTTGDSQVDEQVPGAPIEQVVVALNEGNREARLGAIERLGQIGGLQAVQALGTVLQDRDDRVRTAASVQLMMLAYTGSDADVKQYATRVLKEWADSQPEQKKSSGRDPFAPAGGSRLGAMVLAFIAGVLLWGIPILLVMLLGRALPEQGFPGSEVVGIVILIAIVIFFYVVPISSAMRGWSWMSGYGSGTYGEAIKFVVMLVIAMTGVGLIFIVYWTGKGGLEWLGERGIIRV